MSPLNLIIPSMIIINDIIHFFPFSVQTFLEFFFLVVETAKKHNQNNSQKKRKEKKNEDDTRGRSETAARFRDSRRN